MELIVKEYEQPKPIEFNYEELKAELLEKVSHYETLVYTDDQIKEAKADRANLNKFKKALNDERLRREREYMEPFNGFKQKVGDLIAIVDKPVGIIDAQVKAYEEKCREEKGKAIAEFFEALEAKPDWLTLALIWDEQWLNASYPMKAVQTDIQEAVNRVNVNLDTLKALSEFAFEALEVYKGSLDINKAISEGKRLADIQRRKEEQAKLEAVKSDPVQEAPKASEAEEVLKPTKQWIAFRAYMTVADAVELKRFFENRGISFEPVKEV